MRASFNKAPCLVVYISLMRIIYNLNGALFFSELDQFRPNQIGQIGFVGQVALPQLLTVGVIPQKTAPLAFSPTLRVLT